MIERIRDWWIDNNHEICWFIIGYLVSDGLYQLGRGNLFGAGIAFGFAFLNYILNKR